MSYGYGFYSEDTAHLPDRIWELEELLNKWREAIANLNAAVFCEDCWYPGPDYAKNRQLCVRSGLLLPEDGHIPDNEVAVLLSTDGKLYRAAPQIPPGSTMRQCESTPIPVRKVLSMGYLGPNAIPYRILDFLESQHGQYVLPLMARDLKRMATHALVS